MNALAKIGFDYSLAGTLRVHVLGEWRIFSPLPQPQDVIARLEGHMDIRDIAVEFSGIQEWDSGLVSFLLGWERECARRKVRVSYDGLPPGAHKLLTLASAGNKKNTQRPDSYEAFTELTGKKAAAVTGAILALLDFLGETVVAFGRFLGGKAYFRRDDFIFIVQRCGADAFFLVSLISVLVGVILAFVGAIQLKMFGAQVFIADIVGIAMVRVMGAVMTGVFIAGRTGASFAAELGMMQVNEEIDALKTLGISPVEFLVVPRVLALVIMLPLLTIYSGLMGIAGGFIVSTGILGINPAEYLAHTQDAVKLSHVWVGIIHSAVFAVIIAVAGCFHGFSCERNAEAVGEKTTAAVVSGITGIVIATALITFVCQVLGV